MVPGMSGYLTNKKLSNQKIYWGRQECGTMDVFNQLICNKKVEKLNSVSYTLLGYKIYFLDRISITALPISLKWRKLTNL